MNSRIILSFCFVITLTSRYCETKDNRLNIFKFLTNHDTKGLELQDNEESRRIRKKVKRSAPEKNGGTSNSGNEFPMLTSIPTTSFSCRGLKSGYYADLETNCQVFHICDNARKISFLCPNGTIFQQSQLICDWWFKVDCSKSTELYEQSAEHLADEERKRLNSKRINSEFRRGSSNSYDNNVNYDGKQNGRTNPYGQISKNQLIEKDDYVDAKTVKPFDPNDIYSQNNQNSKTNPVAQINDLAAGSAFAKSQTSGNVYDENHNLHQQQQQQQKFNDVPLNRQRNQDYYTINKQLKNDYKGIKKYSSQIQQSQDNNFNNLGQGDTNKDIKTKESNFGDDDNIHRSTPVYTETNTFRASSVSPIVEYQQLAESSGFVSKNNNQYIKSGINRYTNYYNNKIPSPRNISKERQLIKYPKLTTLQPNTNNNNRNTNNRFRYSTTPTTVTNRVPSTYETTTFASTYSPYGESTRNLFYDNNYNKYTTVSNNNDDSTTLLSTMKYFKTTTNSYRDDVTSTIPTTAIDESLSTFPTTSYTDPVESVHLDFRKNDNYQKYDFTEKYDDNTLSTSDYVRSTYAIVEDNTRRSPVQTTLRPEFTTSYYSTITTTPIPPSFSSSSSSSSSSTTNPITRKIDKNVKEANRLATSRSSMRWQNNYRQTTEKPSSSSTSSSPLLQNSINTKTPSPYDTSFTYKHGKLMSTLGPYVPFTKNYAYTTKSPTSLTTPTTRFGSSYTPTVPIYTAAASSTESPYTRSTDSILKKKKNHEASTYLPKINSLSPREQKAANPFSSLPIEREHVINMIESLKNLKTTVAPPVTSTSITKTVTTVNNHSYHNRSGLHVPYSSSPATLHSLALYFATTNDTSVKSMKSNLTKMTSDTMKQILKNATDLPSSILTQHTINAYAELFNLNNAIETNSSVNTELVQLDDGEDNEDISDDLDLQQSQGPLHAAKKSNNTKLRELAQIFTHALSAYLQDPDSFKQILTKIRPTEPPAASDEFNFDEFTTSNPDDVNDNSRIPTGFTPTTTSTPTEIPNYTEQDGLNYFPTSVSSSGFVNPSTVTPLFNSDDTNYFSSTVLTNNFNSPATFDISSTEKNYYDEIRSNTLNSIDVTPNSNINYFSPIETTYRSEITEEYKNTESPFEPIDYNYSPYSTLSSSAYNDDTLLSTGHEDMKTIALRLTESDNKTTSSFNNNNNELDLTTTKPPFMIRYYDSTTIELDDHDDNDSSSNNKDKSEENLLSLTSSDKSNERENKNIENDELKSTYSDADVTNHWTSSPLVTRLWENSVFIDPKHINQGLTSENKSQTKSINVNSSSATTTTTTTPATVAESISTNSEDDEILVTDSSNRILPNSKRNNSLSLIKDNDTPTAFSLLPKVHSNDYTATPTPIYTTRSSITTTITSSITSKSSFPASDLITNLNGQFLNKVEDDMTKAKLMFGNLNDTSSDKLMKVMKEADKNATVRQLVLLLIRNCDGPMNKTKEQDKEELLNALLKMPVNGFTSEESRELVAGIDKYNFPIASVTSTSSDSNSKSKSDAGQTSVLTVNVNHKTSGIDEYSNDSSNSDERALELLKSLYSIAAKWS